MHSPYHVKLKPFINNSQWLKGSYNKITPQQNMRKLTLSKMHISKDLPEAIQVLDLLTDNRQNKSVHVVPRCGKSPKHNSSNVQQKTTPAKISQ